MFICALQSAATLTAPSAAIAPTSPATTFPSPSQGCLKPAAGP